MSAKTLKTKYYLNSEGQFVIENYNRSKPFSSFFPGIAGKYGIPLWAFYVNRGQCLCSFGTKDKDHAILEFFSANKAWQFICQNGFRTFIKIRSAKKIIFYEPFQDTLNNSEYKITNRMRISSCGLIIEEENASLGLQIKIEYFSVPGDNYAGLGRIVTVTNRGRKDLAIELIDGLPQIVPFGTNNFFLKKMGRTIEAWMNVENLENSVPFYKLDVDPSDRPEVIHIEEGNFYLGFHYKSRLAYRLGRQACLLKPIVDPACVFGQVTSLLYPAEFIAASNFKYPKNQTIKSKTPCALLWLNLKLKPKENKTFYSVIGHARGTHTLNNSVKRIIKDGYLENKLQTNNELIKSLQQDIHTSSSSKNFDLYAKQTYIDNIMRGGYPVILGRGNVFYLYARKHGDPERDYNKFQLQPAYFSQGNGNYRDMNQNRRLDNWFNPEVSDSNLIYFLNLIQTDGFNPLILKGESFKLNDNADLDSLLGAITGKSDVDKLKSFLAKPFTPGELIFFVEENKIKLNLSYDEFLNLLVSSSATLSEAEHGEGFWTDHWAYNLDLIDSYLGIYPEKAKELFFQKKVFTYFDNAEIVKPRSEKYLLFNKFPRQLHSVGVDPLKKELIRKRSVKPHISRSNQGNGEIYYTTLINKLLCLAVNKLSSLDSSGVGVEMEANKPNWFDSLNGLPALFGSSTCETFELKRLLLIIKDALENCADNSLTVTKEIVDFIRGLMPLFADEAFAYWDKSAAIKEDYRHNSRFGFSGNEETVETNYLKDFINRALNKVETGIEKAFDKKTGVYCSYYINEAAEYDLVKEHYIKPKKFIQKPVPLFLEGQMHALRLSREKNQALALHKAAKNSRLFDKNSKCIK